jgi:myo-inositol-hexaphosphate 3-phosphohydrolase
MPQGISPNPLNKISEVYLSQISEHHKKDADGNTIPHEDDLDEAKKPMVKVKLKDPSKIKVKVTDIGPGGKEYVRKNEMDEAMAMKPSLPSLYSS